MSALRYMWREGDVEMVQIMEVPTVAQLTDNERDEFDLRVQVGEDPEHVLHDILSRRHVQEQLH